jgi:hypothetical protein
LLKSRKKSLDYNWLTPKAQMRQTPGKGSGSFAIAKINKGEVVASFGGFVVDEDELKNHSEDRVARSLQLDEKTYLQLANKSILIGKQLGGFINYLKSFKGKNKF